MKKALIAIRGRKKYLIPGLEELGVKALFVSDAKKFLEILEREKSLSFVVLDLDIPGISSNEIFKPGKIKKPGISFIVVSKNPEEALTAVRYGADDCIIKPLTFEKLKFALILQEDRIKSRTDLSRPTKNIKFVHLHLHTGFSLLDGIIKLGPLFEQARDYGMPALAMTNHMNLFGAIEFCQLARRYGIKPILGCEFDMAPGNRLDEKRNEADEEAFHLVLLARDLDGYRNLLRLLNMAHLEDLDRPPQIDREILSRHREGLIGLSSCLKGEIPRYLAQGRKDEARRAARDMTGIFGPGRFFLEIQRNGLPDQEKVNLLLIELARELYLPLVATNNSHYLERKDADAYDILLALQAGKPISEMERKSLSSDAFYLRSPEEMKELFRDLPEAIENALRISEDCNLDLKLGERRYPAFPLPRGMSADQYLGGEIWSGLKTRREQLAAKGRFDPENESAYITRLAEELRFIRKADLAIYFLVVADFVRQAWKKGIPVGPGRGPVPASLVAFALGITEIDPIAEGLVFERFLNESRTGLPDIDVDFGSERRDEVYEYLLEKYGEDKVGHVATFSVIRPRAAIRDAGRVLEMHYDEVDQVAKLIPLEPEVDINSALEREPQLREMFQKDPRVRNLINTALAIEGMVRHASPHVSGVVIADRPLVDYLPLFRGGKGEVVTHFTSEELEACGLVTFDLLGLEILSILERTVQMIEESGGKRIVLSEIPLDDSKTYQMLSAGKTAGIFQFESPEMAEILTRVRPSEFRDLVSLAALHRSDPLGGNRIDKFIERKHSKRARTQYRIPRLEKILGDTYGLIIFQEQIMKIANQVGGISLTESDQFRKTLAKKKQEDMEKARFEFVEGAIKNKVPRKEAEKLFEEMAKCTKYAFNKSHSAAYTLIAYQCAYLKANYPEFFLTALLSADSNDEKVRRIIGELVKRC